MSPAGTPLRGLIEAVRRGVHRDVRIAAVAAAATVIPLVLAMAWLLAGRADWATPGAGPLVLEIAGILALVLVGAGAWRRWGRGTREQDVAATAERTLGLAAGSVMGALELGRDVPPGTSSALARLAEQGVARSFEGRTAREVSGDVGRLARRRRTIALAALAALSAVTAVLAFASPSRTQSGWAPLLNPVAHLSASHLPPVSAEPGDVEVIRGGDVDVLIRAPGRLAVTLAWRAAGDVLRRETVTVAEGAGAATIARIDAVTQYWVEAPDGARSPAYRIVPRDPLLVSELLIEIRYPEYLGRTQERFATEMPPLELPEGTTVVVSGRATRDLNRAALLRPGGEVALTVTGDRFAASFVPAASGLYEWMLQDATGATLSSAPPPLDLTIVADAPPEVEITYPARDTVLDPDRVHLVAGDGRDDYGLASATLVTWRITAGGRSLPRVESPIPLTDEGERTLLRAVIDLRDTELLPGDTIRYFMRVTDGSPRRQTGESRVYAIYVPDPGSLRERVDREAGDAVRDAEELARAARDLQEDMRNLQRRTEANRARRSEGTNADARTGARGEQGTLGFREAEQGRQVLEQQEQMTAGLEELRDRMQALEKLMKNRTALVVAHRLSTVRHADRIIVMNRGRVIESGSHAALMAQQGFYYRLNHLQT